jgi:hypothetical protein
VGVASRSHNLHGGECNELFQMVKRFETLRPSFRENRSLVRYEWISSSRQVGSRGTEVII